MGNCNNTILHLEANNATFISNHSFKKQQQKTHKPITHQKQQTFLKAQETKKNRSNNETKKTHRQPTEQGKSLS